MIGLCSEDSPKICLKILEEILQELDRHKTL